jgi:hypothetical protein
MSAVDSDRLADIGAARCGPSPRSNVQRPRRVAILQANLFSRDARQDQVASSGGRALTNATL